MPRTKSKPRKPTISTPPAAASITARSDEVLTLAEAAAFLRVSEDDVLRLVGPEGIPGRVLGSEWRFLKSALEDWLRTPPPRGSKEAVASVAGIWKDDPEIERELKEIYQRRGRPMTGASA